MRTASEALPLAANTQPWSTLPTHFHNKAPVSSAKATTSSSLRACYGVVPAVDMGHRREAQRRQQSGGLSDFARILDRAVRIRKGASG